MSFNCSIYACGIFQTNYLNLGWLLKRFIKGKWSGQSVAQIGLRTRACDIQGCDATQKRNAYQQVSQKARLPIRVYCLYTG